MKNFWLEPEQKKVNKKKLIISIIIAIFFGDFYNSNNIVC